MMIGDLFQTRRLYEPDQNEALFVEMVPIMNTRCSLISHLVCIWARPVLTLCLLCVHVKASLYK